MVEFSDVAAAKNAKEVLQDKDIYDGCNTIKVEYARTQKLNVYKVCFSDRTIFWTLFFRTIVKRGTTLGMTLARMAAELGRSRRGCWGRGPRSRWPIRPRRHHQDRPNYNRAHHPHHHLNTRHHHHPMIKEHPGLKLFYKILSNFYRQSLCL